MITNDDALSSAASGANDNIDTSINLVNPKDKPNANNPLYTNNPPTVAQTSAFLPKLNILAELLVGFVVGL